MNKKLAILATVLVVFSSFVGGVAAHGDEDHQYNEQVTVEVKDDGDARLSIIEVYDLNSSDEKAAFNDLKKNEDSQQTALDNFRSRMTRLADAVSNETGRDVTVRSANINLQVTDDGNRGVVVYSVVFENLAAVDGNTVTLSEPFASGFNTDKRFVVISPEGFNISSVTPQPDQRDEQFLVWESPSFDSFEVVFTNPNATEEPTTTDDGANTPGSPGFGAGIALIALVASAVLAYRRE